MKCFRNFKWSFVRKRTIIRGIILLVCLVVFAKWYLITVFEKYALKYTNTAKFDLRIEEVHPPAITICFEPHFKKSVHDKYKTHDGIFFENTHPQIVSNMTIKVSLDMIQFFPKI